MLTYENLLYSIKLLPDDTKSVTIITSDFHCARAKMLAKKLDLEADFVEAKTPKVVEQKLRFRERLALVKSVVFDN
ncbi:YdcF family protein [Ureibacillus thermophilus]|uniref:YdcF family protein n=1 Tax=Ureibacillus thermophilus TaxID=367743 RepID=UPI003615717D